MDVSKQETPSRTSLVALHGRLEARGPSFNFFQAVRALLLAGGGESIGHDHNPRREVVRFRSQASLVFPSEQVAGFEPPRGKDGATEPPVLEVAFLGLTGPAGVLPRHYTETLIARIRSKDYALRDFLGLYDHRLVSLFYRSWEKHRVGALIENGASSGEVDRFSTALFSLVALGPEAARERFDFSDHLFVYFGGLFAHHPRNASSLERLLTAFVGVAIEVQQFVGQWLSLEDQDQTRLSSFDDEASNGLLGVTAIAGERVWGRQSKFRLRLGPMKYDDFLRLTPLGDALGPLGQLTRSYAGPEFDFDVQPVLQKEEVPACRLGGNAERAPRLGWNTWALSGPMRKDAEEAVFVSDGAPSR